MICGKRQLWCRILVVIFGLLTEMAAYSSVVARPVRNPQDLAIIHGNCDKFLAYGTDITERCDDKVANVDYSDGRNSFTFMSRDAAVVITFSGNGRSQIHQGPDTAVQPLDAILAHFQGRTDIIKAVGSCRFTNPYKGKATVNCEADTPQGEFAGSFITDGQAPDMKHLR